ncbi:stage II sporulation protein R [Effusibacillus dendaii]|uniref:Stage II sporulation protein R n=1 Tax=Effusibacillus dendaii TaxID=2743772 RepID=A0A7I8DGE4_9BACL|nr:stage II sporulation protein R [Effusibacillus dendaii]BCJ87660.1 hypothetical protein skT53_26450 [Effusibacillus dendaii]
MERKWVAAAAALIIAAGVAGWWQTAAQIRFLSGSGNPSLAAAAFNETETVTRTDSIGQADSQSEDKSDLLSGNAGIIPKEAVRLRIIANSDSPEDQTLKRQIRDQIIQEVGTRLRGVENIEEARTVIRQAVPDMNRVAEKMEKEKGYSYPIRTDYGMVPFPTKMYGNNVYPAGNYEALRIVIGEGKGQNWWCVLFPPLCFVDLANGDAVQAKNMDSKPLTTISVPSGNGNAVEKVQVRLGLVDAIRSLFAKIRGWFESLKA